MNSEGLAPGPWGWDDDGNLVAADGQRVLPAAGLLFDSPPADATLIAAALELLELLILIRDVDEDCKLDGLPRKMPDFIRARVDAVIARAEGREP